MTAEPSGSVRELGSGDVVGMVVKIRRRIPYVRKGERGPRAGPRVDADAPYDYMIGSGSLARSAAPTSPALLPSCAAMTSATGRQLPPTSQRL